MERAGNQIIDDKGRALILRGVNLGGSSKIPVPGNELSFAGRPFPLEEADTHFNRLRNWGFTFIRLIVTWEALEHSGHGIYDEMYLAYLRKLLLLAEKYGISVYMDPHQDVWSRYTGGDGAPAWTLEKLGMDIDKLEAAGAAIITRPSPKQQQKSRPMIWPVNYSLYAAATMFTLFFAGNAFAPEVKIEGQSAQDFLSESYLAAFRHCYRRLKNCKAIVGWGTMNEPHPGFIGYSDLRNLENVTLALGPVPSPFQAMRASSGEAVKAPVYTPWIKGWKITGSRTINPQGTSIFKEGFTCPWKQAGIWVGEGNDSRLLRPDHFSAYRGRRVDFSEDFLKPFMFRFMERMNEADRPLLFFIEGIPNGEHPSWNKEDSSRQPNTVNAFHHYDGLTLFTKNYRPWFTADQKTGRIILGKKKTAALFSENLSGAKKWSAFHMDSMPCLLGEFGLPFDLNKKKAYKTGDYSLHEKALSSYYDALDENLLSSTIWNYTADNTNKEGDHWNGEDLSIVSEGEGRAMGGWLRPYPMAVAGIPLFFKWDRKAKTVLFRYHADAKIIAPTEIFIPSQCFDEAFSVSVSPNDGRKEPRALRREYAREEQRLFIHNDGYEGEVVCRITNNAVK